jgi:hypothetical protein
MGATYFYEIQHNTVLWAKMNVSPNDKHERWGVIPWNTGLQVSIQEVELTATH